MTPNAENYRKLRLRARLVGEVTISVRSLYLKKTNKDIDSSWIY